MKELLRTGVSRGALALGMRRLDRSASSALRKPLPISEGGPTARSATAARHSLMYFIVLVWIAAGLADWACHRVTEVEYTGGASESLLHIAMMAEVGVPALAAMFLEINAPVFAMMLGGFLAHEATAFWDVRYATT